MYEIAAPADAIFAQIITLDIREEIRQKALDGDEDYDVDDMLNSVSERYDEEPAFEADDRFVKDSQHPFIMPGDNDWKVPLQISKARQWPESKFNKGADSVYIGTTRLCHEKIRERAIHIFEEVFKTDYDFLYNNCHAFVCYLYTSIQLLDPPQLKYNSRIFREPLFQHRHFWASVSSYCVWKHVIGETIPPPPDPRWKYWEMKEKHIEYDELKSPREMKELLEPREQLPAKKQPPPRTGLPSHHEPPRSHAVHTAAQAHHDSKHNMMDVLNATIVQNQMTQQNQMTDPNASSGIYGLPMPGIM